MTGSRTARVVSPQVGALDALSRWLGSRLPHATGIHLRNVRYLPGADMSGQTILFDAVWHQAGTEHTKGLVVRVKPTQHTLHLDDLFNEHYAIIQLMHAQKHVRVAKPLWFETNGSILGAPFFVMEKIEGRVALNYPPHSNSGLLVDAGPAERRRVWESAVRQLASIQLVPVTSAAFLALPGGPTGFDQEVSRWRRFLSWVDPGSELTLLRATFKRLLAAGPSNKADGIAWGDARLGNMMIDSNFEVAAVVNWEQPSLGGALHDLGWWLQCDYNQTTRQGFSRLDGMGDRADTIALWSEVSGKSAADIEWYEAFACFKMECLALRMAALRKKSVGSGTADPGRRTAEMLNRL